MPTAVQKNQCVCVYSMIMAMLRLITNLTISIKTDGGSVSAKRFIVFNLSVFGGAWPHPTNDFRGSGGAMPHQRGFE